MKLREVGPDCCSGPFLFNWNLVVRAGGLTSAGPPPVGGREGGDVKKVALFITAVLMAVAASSIALAAPVGGSSSPSIQPGAVARAVFRAAQSILPILGAIELTRAILLVIKAVHDGFSGREAVQMRLLNIGIAVVLIAIPLTGVWVPLANALLAVIERALKPLEGAL